MTNWLYKTDWLSASYSFDRHPDLAQFFLHTHALCELYFFIAGEGAYIVEGTTYRLKPNTLLLMRPAEAHCMKIDPNVPYERIVIQFTPDLFAPIDPEKRLLQPLFQRRLGQNNLYTCEELQSPNLDRTLCALFDNKPTSEQEAALRIQAYLFPILYRVREVFLSRTNQAPETDSLANQIILYVNRHLTDPLSLDMLSRRFFLSKSQLNRIFINATGESVWKYVIIKRLMDARARIQAGESVNNVCASYGNWDYSAFYRAYKKRFGHSPKQDE